MSSSRRSRTRRFRGFLANILIAVLGVVALLLLVGLFLPRRVRVERSVRVGAALTHVSAAVSSGSGWSAWAPWGVEGEPAGTPVGEDSRGRIRLARFETNQTVGLVLTTPCWGGDVAWEGTLRLESSAGDGSGCRVVWTLEGDLGGRPWTRYGGVGLRRRVGLGMEDGLKRLRDGVEARVGGGLPKGN